MEIVDVSAYGLAFSPGLYCANKLHGNGFDFRAEQNGSRKENKDSAYKPGPCCFYAVSHFDASIVAIALLIPGVIPGMTEKGNYCSRL